MFAVVWQPDELGEQINKRNERRRKEKEQREREKTQIERKHGEQNKTKRDSFFGQATKRELIQIKLTE